MTKPHRIIGESYLHRWHLLPRNPFLNVYLHRFIGSDDDRALHDHPWPSLSILLKGTLFEIFSKNGSRMHQSRRIRRGVPVFRRATFAHRLVLGVGGDAWTLFLTGPVIRPWGFICPKGWVHHKDFTDATGTRIGRGCG